MKDKSIHFGNFIRWKRLDLGLSQRKMAQRVNITDRRLSQIEQMQEPTSHDLTLASIAKALGMEPTEFEKAWRSSPVPKFKGKESPRASKFKLSQDVLDAIQDLAVAQGITGEELVGRWIQSTRKKRIVPNIGDQVIT